VHIAFSLKLGKKQNLKKKTGVEESCDGSKWKNGRWGGGQKREMRYIVAMAATGVT
jgi:hypothetical protein